MKKFVVLLLLGLIIAFSSCTRRTSEKIIEGKDGKLYLVVDEHKNSSKVSLENFGNGVYYYTCPYPKSDERDVINKFGPILSSLRNTEDIIALSPDIKAGEVYGYWILTPKNKTQK